MKYIPFILFALAFCMDTNAQEVQSDLIFNRAYSNDFNYKSNSGLTELCNQNQINFEIVEIIKPTCGEADGSITININSDVSENKLYLNDQLIDETGASDYTFTNVESGAYLVKVGGDGAVNCEQFITIDGIDAIPLEEDKFTITNAFCGNGKIGKVITPQSDTTSFAIFNLSNEIVGTIGLFPKSLEPGNYYVRKKIGGSTCNSYFGFTIEDVPSNDLPFLEDFSREIIYPNPNKWADKRAFVNRTFANSPYTLGVATLDGLNEFGQPYRVNNQLLTDTADVLTSNPFCGLDDFEGDALYLGFFYQPQGISDFPDGTDTLFVEALDSEDNWHELWKISGDSATNNTTFEKVVLTIKNDSTFEDGQTFFFDGFQFRFRNTATVTGMNDPWHLDYIRLNEIENNVSEISNDIAFVYDMQPLLKNYHSMPWDQFYDFQEQEFVDSLRYIVRLNDDNLNSGINADGKYDIFELCDSIPIESSDQFNISGAIGEEISKSTPFDINNLPDLGADKDIDQEDIVVRCNLSLDTGNDFLTQNDTLEYNQIFSNYFAYDDGTAEKAYGLLGPGAQLAVKFETNAPTVLRGVQIYFTHIVGDVSQNRFSIKAWQSLDQSGSIAKEDTVLLSKSGLTPYYTNEIGGFTTYLFESDTLINGTFYVGLEQSDADILNIGQDINNLIPYDGGFEGDMRHLFAEGKTFYNSNGIWSESIIAGAVMIRPLVGQREIFQTGISNLEKVKLAIYPNPTTGLLNISGVENIANYQVNIYDMTGKHLQQFDGRTNQIDVSNLAAGMYMIQLTDEQQRVVTNDKFIKH